MTINRKCHSRCELKSCIAVKALKGFWHRHRNCKYFRLPNTNIEFWQKEIERNKEHDK